MSTGDTKAEAAALHAQAMELEEAGQLEEAAEAYRRCLALNPGSAATWFNLALIYKRQRRWDDALEANGQAHTLDPSDQPTCWNLGIAASAVGEWETARQAWRAFGLDLPDGEGPPEVDLGPIPVRLGEDDDAEVVWATRLDPARARIDDEPTTPGYARGDVVLHDGEPRGWRVLDDRELPVFDVLAVLSNG
jgi:tetratricopeptide (TPR) repeat protein